MQVTAAMAICQLPSDCPSPHGLVKQLLTSATTAKTARLPTQSNLGKGHIAGEGQIFKGVEFNVTPAGQQHCRQTDYISR